MLEFVERTKLRGKKIAIFDSTGNYKYGDLLERSSEIASNLLGERSDLGGARVAILIPSGFSFVATLWATWRAGGVAVPLCVSHPSTELDYVLKDSDASILIYSAEFSEMVSKIQVQNPKIRFETDSDLVVEAGLFQKVPDIDEKRPALILYTSGTTGKPKGVVLTHSNLRFYMECLTEAWAWSGSDHILHVLPLHHMHGIVNVLCCALWAGASLEMLSKFDPDTFWSRLIEGRPAAMTVFMAVPTIYSRLLQSWEAAPEKEKKRRTEQCAKLRLMVSGSAALPTTLFEKWKEVSKQTLLERYGMTEIGMALSNPLIGERRPGTVGTPLPGVYIRIADGEIQVKGSGVFLEYWNRPKETQTSFSSDGWFKTGDVAEVSKDGYYKILGRNSVDIIKSGGYKISALEVEEKLRLHPKIRDCAVVGISDPEWGERIAAALILNEDVSDADLKAWSKEQMAHYKIPTLWNRVSELPRNAMGKVVKQEVKKLFR